MRIRQIQTEDDISDMADVVAKCHNFPMPDGKNAIIGLVVEDNEGNKVAFGIVKLFAEAIFIPDLSKPKPTVTKAVALLLNTGLDACHKAGIEQLHCFIQNPAFADLLKDKYNFTECTGKALVAELTDGEGRSEKNESDDRSPAPDESRRLRSVS